MAASQRRTDLTISTRDRAARHDKIVDDVASCDSAGVSDDQADEAIIDPVSTKFRDVIFERARLAPNAGTRRQIYDQQAAPCQCPPVARFVGVPALPVEVEIRNERRRKIKHCRCLMCGTRWTTENNEYRAREVRPPSDEDLRALCQTSLTPA